MKTIVAATLMAALSLSACGQKDPEKAAAAAAGITLSDGWCRATPKDATATSCFITITNGGPTDDRLLGGQSSAAAMVQVDETYADGNIMRMRAIEGLAVPASKAVTLVPGGNLVRLEGLTAPMVVGATIPVTLNFEAAGAKQVLFPVRIEAEVGPAK
ncbi:copper chaperone PCu(A)C [Caulobacter sp. NIBR1757]|uniref:copper chaperone PCu(A)C n=1 Tax=Caulobacter sp. NIBR1757 TaxID=3016000 RepID=UPI0022F058FE|nr:copper chaperone PCu(A)C [Caulobacter sp. NIBR1757]WGM38585.1 hypothetical protein AMEJIAPC_01488 [Caulobacter sp. NIBR1757]